MASIVEVAHATDGAPGKLAAPAPVARAMPEWSDKEKAKIRRVFDECDTDRSGTCLLYTSPSPRDRQKSRMPSSA